MPKNCINEKNALFELLWVSLMMSKLIMIHISFILCMFVGRVHHHSLRIFVTGVGGVSFRWFGR